MKKNFPNAYENNFLIQWTIDAFLEKDLKVKKPNSITFALLLYSTGEFTVIFILPTITTKSKGVLRIWTQ